jgi:thiazole synthase ThiGH ThiG subunit
MHYNDLIQRIVDSKFIACVASLTSGNTACLDLPIALSIIKESGTRALVYCTPHCDCLDDVIEYRWSFPDLLNHLPSKEYVLLSNTSRAKTADDAVQMALTGREIFKTMPHAFQQTDPIIKLEVLDKSLRSDDEAVLNALESLMKRHNFTVIPLISPNVKVLEQCVDLNVPFVRILSGNIGSLAGLNDKTRLRDLASNSKIPLFFEGGLGTPRHVQEAFALGASGVLLNSAFHRSINPVLLAREIRNVLDGIPDFQVRGVNARVLS